MKKLFYLGLLLLTACSDATYRAYTWEGFKSKGESYKWLPAFLQDSVIYAKGNDKILFRDLKSQADLELVKRGFRTDTSNATYLVTVSTRFINKGDSALMFDSLRFKTLTLQDFYKNTAESESRINDPNVFSGGIPDMGLKRYLFEPVTYTQMHVKLEVWELKSGRLAWSGWAIRPMDVNEARLDIRKDIRKLFKKRFPK